MASEARLPARVQTQVWVNDYAVDVGPEIEFDAHAAATGLRAGIFRRVAAEILGGRHDCDELAIDSGVVEKWLSAGGDNTLRVDVDEEDFEAWLESVGLDRDSALAIDEDGMDALRARVAVAAAPVAP